MFEIAMRNAVRTWAASKPQIVKAWLYGSRVKGTATETSDWDVAISLDLPSVDANRRFWFDVIDEWNTELAQAAGCDVELQFNNPPETPLVASGVGQAGVLVYQRP
jgi:uncharacterized protein